MPTSPRRFVEQVRGILSERRNLSRIPCDIVMLDGGGCAHRIENIGLSGIRYAAPVLPPEGAQRFTLRLPNLDSSLSLDFANHFLLH